MIDRVAQSLFRWSKRQSRRNLYEWTRQAIGEHGIPSRKDVVNIGAGGEVSAQLLGAGVRAVSVDIDAGRGPDVLASVEDLVPFADNSVDALFCLEVLEHVPHPHRAVSEIRRILRPGGIVVGSTPFLLGVHDAPRDYFRYTRHGLTLLFNSFDQLTLRERNGYFSAVAVLIGRRFAICPSEQRSRLLLLAPLLLPLAWLIGHLDRVLPAEDATTGYFFVFRKPAEASFLHE